MADRRAPRSGAVWRNWPDTPEFQEMLHREFPEQAAEWTDPLSAAQVSGADGRVAGPGRRERLLGTHQPPEHIVPYVRHPEEIVPGKPLFFATAHDAGRVADGVCWSRATMGRPTKIEGNPSIPPASARPTPSLRLRADALRS